MNRAVTIDVNPGRRCEVALHPEKAAALGLTGRKFTCVRFGNLRHYAQIRISSQIGRDQLGIAAKLMRELLLPEYPVYELKAKENELCIGPLIGLLLSAAGRKLTTSRLKRLLVYVEQYALIQGVVVVFALDGVDRSTRRIEGYCFDPGAKGWRRGIFPYPASIYRTIGLGSEWKNHFLSALGNGLFNLRYFNKWEMYQWFVGDPTLNSYLPYTQLYDSPQGILEQLNRFSQVFVKPVLGLRGHGVVRIGSADQNFTFEYRQNNTNHTVVIEGWEQASQYITTHFGKGKYLIQQPVQLLEYQGRRIDFRCVVQKNQVNAWVCQAMIGRLGAPDSVVSNISSGGEAFTAVEILRMALPVAADQIDRLLVRMKDLALQAGNKLDQLGLHCGTLGMDIAVDHQGALWLIEINNRDPDPGIALDIHDPELYRTLKTGPLLYAKYLAGFGPVAECKP